MCFSATASFTLFGALVPLGAYTLAKAPKAPVDWRPFAAFPLAFGLQQGFEGFVWLGLDSGQPDMVAWAARGFLFFSHFFWLVWVPFSSRALEVDPTRRRILGYLTVLSFAYGLSIFAPSFLLRDWLNVELAHLSIDYQTRLIYDGIFERSTLKLFYAAIILSALFMSSDRRIIIFGVMIMVSLAVTYAFFAYAFISVWCFFAAILSAYMTVVIVRAPRRASPA
ncbi:MAG: hypothetical protein KJP02_12820 [Octadecabacter sp.]|nr:hypothetical protein [Octadecabacter sp.]